MKLLHIRKCEMPTAKPYVDNIHSKNFNKLVLTLDKTGKESLACVITSRDKHLIPKKLSNNRNSTIPH